MWSFQRSVLRLLEVGLPNLAIMEVVEGSVSNGTCIMGRLHFFGLGDASSARASSDSPSTELMYSVVSGDKFLPRVASVERMTSHGFGSGCRHV